MITVLLLYVAIGALFAVAFSDTIARVMRRFPDYPPIAGALVAICGWFFIVIGIGVALLLDGLEAE